MVLKDITNLIDKNNINSLNTPSNNAIDFPYLALIWYADFLNRMN